MRTRSDTSGPRSPTAKCVLGDRRALSLPDEATVILVDAGIATGSTVIAAIRALRQQRVARLVLAIPVAPLDTAALLRDMVDELVVLSTPLLFWAVGAFYEDFGQVSDDEVCELLAQAKHAERSAARQNGWTEPIMQQQ